MSPVEQKELDKFLEENLASGRIRPSKSPMASPVFFVDKKDSKLRFVQDYWKLNAMTVKNTYMLPLVPNIINKISEAKAKYFMKLDIHWGYNNVRIKEGDEWKAAFQTNCGLFEPLVMYFGLTNSPATFQTMMNNIFKELIDEGFVAIYMDDILIYTRTIEHHREVVTRVLSVLRKHQLYLKAEKCSFECLTVKYLGLVLSEGCWDGPSQNCWSQRMADSEKCDRSPVLCWLRQLLSEVYTQLLPCSQPPPPTDQEG